MPSNESLTYKNAGVDIDAGNALVERIKPLAATTRRAEVIGGIGGFGGLFQLDMTRYRQPVLVAGTDGVGSKLKLAIELNRYDGIGVDLVAMCVNDVLVLGAEPLFFLDYYATGRLSLDAAEAVIAGIVRGCREAGAALLGGETAELPGLYGEGDFDLAGFCVGAVDKDHLLDGSAVRAGDRLVGLASSGPHSNGYSLIRRVLDRTPGERRDRAEELLAPTRIYVQPVLRLLQSRPVSAMAHITGGGLPENVARFLPQSLDARIDAGSWQRPAIYEWLQNTGNIAEQEMLRTFNCGIGMVIALRPDDTDNALGILRDAGETAMVIGEVIRGTGRVDIRG